MKAILFDLWGTLVDNGVKSPIKQVRQILNIKVPFPEYVVRMERAMMTTKHETLKDCFLAVCKEFSIEPSEEQLEELVGLWNKSWMLAKPYEETVEVLQKLSDKYILVLISNTDKFSINNILEKFSIRKYFDQIFLSCDVGLIKSDKIFLKHVLNEIGEGLEDCILVGDSLQSDIIPAKKLSMEAILIDRKGNRDYQPKVKDLKELITILNRYD